MTTHVDLLVEGGLTVVDVGYEVALKAGKLRAKHYDRNSSSLSLADCVLVATASGRDQIVTSDPPLVTVADKLGIEVIRLPSAGRPA